MAYKDETVWLRDGRTIPGDTQEVKFARATPYWRQDSERVACTKEFELDMNEPQETLDCQ